MIGERPYRGLLDRLPERAANALINSGHVEAYEPGQVLLRRDDEGTHAVLLLTGTVKIQVDDTTPTLLGVESAGDLVGEMAVLDGRPRSATVVACGRVTARVISRYQLRVLLHEHVELLTALAGVAVDRVRWSNELRRARSGPAAIRIAQVLVHLVHRHGHRGSDGAWTLEIPLTNIELASIAGMKPRTAEKGFSELRNAHVVLSRTRRTITIPELDRLRRLAVAQPEVGSLGESRSTT
ncbi:hypothetical protein SUDANB95_07913 (plasmid) [Actinosynnema sp. ALI-1.44]